MDEKENNEYYNFWQILKQHNTDEFIKAMIKKAKIHEKHKHWDVVSRWEMPPGLKTILAIW